MRTTTPLLPAPPRNNLVAQKRLLKEKLDHFKATLEVENALWSRSIRMLLEYIHAHLFEPTLKVSAARRQCRAKNNNISTYFRQSLGMGMREYIELRRMQAATQLLAHEELEIFLIGLGVGYAHEESFARAFRRRFGCSPSEYRKELAKKKC
jgi:AraC-like DNA-binding protein